MNLKNHLLGVSNSSFSPKKENKTKHRETDDLNDKLGLVITDGHQEGCGWH